MITLDTTLAKMNKLELISVRAMNTCYKLKVFSVKDLLTVPMYQLSRVKNCGNKTIQEIKKIQSEYEYLNKETTKSKYSSEVNEVSKVKKSIAEQVIRQYQLLSDLEKEVIITSVVKASTSLSKRSINVLMNCIEFLHLDTIITYRRPRVMLFCHLEIITYFIYNDVDLLSIKNCGRKSQEEIQQFLAKSQIIIETKFKLGDIENISGNSNIVNKEVIGVNEILFLFPFLPLKQVNVILNFYQQNGYFPYVDLIYYYLNSITDNHSQIRKLYFGFTDLKEYTMDELGQKFGLSRERVRQLLEKKIPLPKLLDNYINEQVLPLMGNFISDQSDLVHSLSADSQILTSDDLFKIFSLIIPSFRIFKTERKAKIKYLIADKVLEDVNLKTIISNIIKRIREKRTVVTKLNLLDFVPLCSEEKKRVIVSFLGDYFKKTFDFEIKEERFIYLMPNTIDIYVTIENILHQKGSPMSLTELQESFNILYPSRAIKDLSKFKQYVSRNPNIRSKGKTGVYMLKSWTNLFSGTQTSYIDHILRTFGYPIPLDDLVTFVLDEYPNTNKKSIYSLIIGDRKKRFMVYENEYIGLTENSNKENNLKTHRIINRQSFDYRFNELKRFVDSLKRFPIQGGTEEEQSLARWVSNVVKRKIEVTDGQYNLLEEFLFINRLLPQNGMEYKFKQMCEQIKVFLSKNFQLPNATNNPSEYNWIRKNLKLYHSYKDNRKIYFEDLLSYINDFGFYIQI